MAGFNAPKMQQASTLVATVSVEAKGKKGFYKNCFDFYSVYLINLLYL